MVTPVLETEIADLLEANVASITSSNLKVGSFTDANNTEDTTAQAVIFNIGGETERRFRFRVMTRANDYLESMTLANDIYEYLKRQITDLTTVTAIRITGQRPQQSGRTESGNYLTSADYFMEFEFL